MRKTLLSLPLLGLLAVGCSKQTAEPISTLAAVKQSAEVLPDFYATTSNGSSATFGRYYYSRDGEFHFAKIIYTRDGEFHLDGHGRLSVTEDATNQGSPVVYFSEPADGKTQVAILDSNGQTIYTVTPAAGATQANLAGVAVSKDQDYTLIDRKSVV